MKDNIFKIFKNMMYSNHSGDKQQGRLLKDVVNAVLSAFGKRLSNLYTNLGPYIGNY